MLAGKHGVETWNNTAIGNLAGDPCGELADWEDDLATIRDMGRVIVAIVESDTDEQAGPLTRLAYMIADKAEDLEQRRPDLWKALLAADRAARPGEAGL